MRKFAEANFLRSLRLASRTARLAAQALRVRGQAARRVRHEIERDIKIEADYVMQRVICEELRANSPWAAGSTPRTPMIWLRRR